MRHLAPRVVAVGPPLARCGTARDIAVEVNVEVAHHGVAAAYLLEDERDLARAAEVVRSLLLCRFVPFIFLVNPLV